MITATYNTPTSEWTQAMDAGLSEWSKHIRGDATLRIDIVFDDAMSFLASCVTTNGVTIGRKNGTKVALPPPAARFQGIAPPVPDFTIKINRTHPWSFGPTPEPSAYWANGVMMHEVGHGLFMTEGIVAHWTPYEDYRAARASQFDGWHFSTSTSPRPLMHFDVLKGATQQITAKDLDVAAACGIPIIGRTMTVHLAPRGRAPFAGDHTAVWWGTLAAFDADTSGCKSLELRGDAPLSTSEQNLYRLYKAALGRDPDFAGYLYWLRTNKSVQDLAAAFVTTAEFAPTLSLWPNRTEYLKRLYRNVLKREPDAAGLNYWAGRTDLDAAGLLASIALSPENLVGLPRFSL